MSGVICPSDLSLLVVNVPRELAEVPLSGTCSSSPARQSTWRLGVLRHKGA